MNIYSVFMILVILIIPVLVGVLLRRDSLFSSYLYGHIILWALFQVVAVPAVQLRWSFNGLFWIYICLVTVLIVLGIKKIPELIKTIHKPHMDIAIILALIIIVFQMCMYIFGQHLDEDDARWIAEANDALTKNKMYLYNPATGDYIGAFRGEMIKDVYSPWAMYIAVISRFIALRPAIVAHTIYAPLLLMMSYIVYYNIGKLLFKGGVERSLFLLTTVVVNLFFSGNPHTQSTFTLVRIWQGKAVVASVIIPLIYMLYLYIEFDDRRKNWTSLIICGSASCLFSVMGISISLIMIGVLGFYAVVKKRWNRIGYLIVAMLPAILYGYGYIVMKG